MGPRHSGRKARRIRVRIHPYDLHTAFQRKRHIGVKKMDRQVLFASVRVDARTELYVVESETHELDSLARESLQATERELEYKGWHIVGTATNFDSRPLQVWQNVASNSLIAVYENIRWALWVDIEGFRHIYNSDIRVAAIKALSDLACTLFSLGSNVSVVGQQRLFIHQAGDGFIVVPNSGDINLLQAVDLAVTLLRKATFSGYLVKVGIGLGTVSDIKGIYPKILTDSSDGNSVSIGGGVMTIFPVMGTGLIDAYSVSQKASGPLLIIRGDLIDALPTENCSILKYKEHIELDWIRYTSDGVDQAIRALHIFDDNHDYIGKIRRYLDSKVRLPDAWRRSAELLIRGY